jgi:hypothetical protein
MCVWAETLRLCGVASEHLEEGLAVDVAIVEMDVEADDHQLVPRDVVEVIRQKAQRLLVEAPAVAPAKEVASGPEDHVIEHDEVRGPVLEGIVGRAVDAARTCRPRASSSRASKFMSWLP